MNPENRTRALYGLFSLLLVIAGLALVRQKSDNSEYRFLQNGGDAFFYRSMTEGSMENVPAPFRYRIAAPTIVRLLPVSPNAGYMFLNAASLFIFYYIGFLLCSHFRFDVISSLKSIIFLFFTQWHLYIYQNPFITDGIVQMLMMVMTYAAVKNRFILFCFFAVVSVAIHERLILYVPIWGIFQSWKKGMGISCIAVILYALLRWSVGSGSIPSVEFPFPHLAALVKPLTIGKEAIIGSGVLYAIAVFGFNLYSGRDRSKLRDAAILFFGVSILPALVVTDTGRMLLGISPLAVLFGASFFEKTRDMIPSRVLLGLSIISSIALIPVTFIPMPTWLAVRKFVIGESLVLCSVMIVWIAMIVKAELNRQENIRIG